MTISIPSVVVQHILLLFFVRAGVLSPGSTNMGEGRLRKGVATVRFADSCLIALDGVSRISVMS